jgi:DNA-binding NtrC family response regulator
MRAVLLVEEDTLIRELMREHLEREGYVTCAVATVRIALNAARWTPFGLVLLDFASADAAERDELKALRALGAPVLMMRSAPAGTVIAMQGEIEQVVWSPFDLSTLTQAVRRFLPAPMSESSSWDEGPKVTRSGTIPVTLPPGERSIAEASTLPAPADPANAPTSYSLNALGALVLETTAGRKTG